MLKKIQFQNFLGALRNHPALYGEGTEEKDEIIQGLIDSCLGFENYLSKLDLVNKQKASLIETIKSSQEYSAVSNLDFSPKKKTKEDITEQASQHLKKDNISIFIQKINIANLTKTCIVL